MPYFVFIIIIIVRTSRTHTNGEQLIEYHSMEIVNEPIV